MKGKLEAVILLPRHLLMGWKSCSGLDIVGDNFGCDVQLAAVRNWSNLEISESSLNSEAC